MAVLLVHSDPEFRDAIAVALRIRGIDVSAHESVARALEGAADAPPVAFLVEPSLLLGEAQDLSPRLASIAGRPVRLVALTNDASREERALFKRHGAGMLAGPVEDIDRIASSLERAVASAPAAAPWEGGAKPKSAAPWEAAPPKRVEKVGAIPPIAKPKAVEKVGPIPAVARPTASRPPAVPLNENDLFGDTADIDLPEPEQPNLPPSAMRAAAHARDAVARGSANDAQLAREGQGPTLLVVDDDPAFRFFLCEALAEKGYRVYISINAPNALRFIKAEPNIALIISDVNMPHMDGFELKHEADQAARRKIPFIALTGEANPDKVQVARKVGVNGLMSKPLKDLEDFYRLVEEALAGKSRRF